MNFVVKVLAAVFVPLAKWLAAQGFSLIQLWIKRKNNEKKVEKAINEKDSASIDDLING